MNTTIVIPAFNREKFISSAIDSALNQTLPPKEIIVVDDGSTDRTVEIVSNYGKPVRLLQIENNGSGPSRPRNVGIQAAETEYITLLDSDDLLAPTVLEKHCTVLEKCPQVGLICNNWKSARDVGGTLTDWETNIPSTVAKMKKTEILPGAYLIDSKTAYTAYCSGNYIRTSGATLTKRLWSDCGKFDETFRTSNDYDFFIRAIPRHDIAFIDKPLAIYIYHRDNISAANLQRKFMPHHYYDTIRILLRELARSNDPAFSDFVKKHIRDKYMDLAYDFRINRQYSSAFSTYRQYLFFGGNYRKYAIAMAKTAVQCSLNAMRNIARLPSKPKMISNNAS
jgi:glycosyltransferase involved in cell wall biosynthesis